MFTLRYIPTAEHEVDPPANIPENLPHRINVSLSSGIDTHYLLYAHSLSPNYDPSHYETICVDFVDTRDLDEPESVKAKEIADKYNVDFVKVVVDDPLEDLSKLIEIVGEPRWNLYPYYLWQEVKNRTGYCVMGDGADELYCGYTFRYKKYLESVNKCTTWEQRAALYLQGHQNDWVMDQEKLFKEPFNWGLILNYLKQFFAEPFFENVADKLNVPTMKLGPVLLADINGKLRYDYLPCNTKLSENLGVKLITPFLVREEFETALRDYKISEKYDEKTNLGKIPLRRMLNRVDDHKRGFGFDLRKYWQRKGFDKVNSKINKDSRVFEYISRDWYNQHLSNIDVPIINKYLQIYSLELYLQLVEEGKIRQELNSSQLTPS